MKPENLFKELQKKFLSNPELLQPLIDKAPYGVFIVDKNKKVLFFNKKAEEITGYFKHETLNETCLISRNCKNCSDSCSMFDNTKAKCIKEVRFITKNNKEIIIEKSSYPILNPYGDPIAAIEFFTDKTEEIKIKKELIHARKQIENINSLNEILSESLLDGIIKIENDFKISIYSQKAQKILQIPHKDLMEKNIEAVFSGNNIKAIKKSLFKLKNKKSNSENLTLYLNGKSINFKLIPVKSINGEYQSTVAFIRYSVKNNHKKDLDNNSETKYYGMVSRSEKMKRIFNLIENLKHSSVNVLIEGKSGTGKELVAKALFKTNLVHNKVFQTINCATLSPDLLESELFGHKKGAFTGAIADKIGKFELADGGTIFLDEIGEMPMNLQAKLLRVLQFKEFDPVGSTKSIKVDVRIIAATNRNLQQAILEGKFREDLYYRIKVVPIYLPNLNERKEDIPILIDYFIDKLNKEHKIHKEISENTKIFLMNYDWPGNIRELENLVSYLYVVTNKSIIEINDLPDYLVNLPKILNSKINRIQSEKEIIIKHLEMFDYNQIKTAQSLGIHRTTLWRKMKKYNIYPPYKF